MIRTSVRIANSTIVFWLLLLPFLIVTFLPGSWWFESRSVTISDADFGTSPVVLEDRAVHIPFYGSYDVVTYNAATNLPTACRGKETLRYGNRLDGTRSMSLVEWSADNPACSLLAPGAYYTRVCRTIPEPVPSLHWLVGAKESCNVSNIFRVDEK